MDVAASQVEKVCGPLTGLGIIAPMSSLRARRIAASLMSLLLLGSCAGKILQLDKSDQEKLRVEEFDSRVKVQEETTEQPPTEVVKEVDEKAAKGKKGKGKAAEKAVAKKASDKEKGKVKGKRQPEIEDDEGFDGRRPLVDPFRVGEKVVFDVSYFAMTAGEIRTEVKPFVTVNGQKAYHFEVSGNSTPFFSKIYEVDDKISTYVRYDDLVPLSLQVSLKESNQVGETRTFFDWKTNKASYWQKKFVKGKGERNKKLEWDILPFSQNVVSVSFYLRNFKLEPGKKHAIRVADEGKNIVFTGEVIKREVLKTPAGELKTVMMIPKVTADGILKPIGDVKLWFTDDDRKLLVRLESKIKIGTVVAKVRSIERGKE